MSKQDTKITNIYVTTKFRTNVSIGPDKLDNKFYINLKENLKKKVEGKCYKNYGYIDEVYKIITRNNGYIMPENFDVPVIVDVVFSCKLCLPVEGSYIICEVVNMCPGMMNVRNGPIKSVIPTSRINENNFIEDRKKMILKIENNKAYEISVGEYVIIKLGRSKMVQNANHIASIGYLERMATEQEISDHFENKHTVGEMVDIDDLVS